MSDGLTEAWREFGKAYILAKNCKFYSPSEIKVNENRYTTRSYVCIHSKDCPADRENCDCR
jgi:hypothetical protein